MARRSEKLQRTLNPRSITDAERRYIDEWNPKFRATFIGQLATYHGYPQAWTIAGYLDARAAGEPSSIVSKATAARYRKVLEELAPIMFDREAA